MFTMGLNFETSCRRGDGESKGESSKRGYLMGKGEKEARNTKRDLMSLFRESLYEQPADVAYTTFEMQSMAPHEGDEKKPRSKGKKADKGKAIDRDPGSTHKRSSKEVEKRREVEPEENQGQVSGLSGALANLSLDDEQQTAGRQVQSPCHEVEDGWMVVVEDIDVWDFTEEVGALPD
ncbi:hypothetical protein GGI43DRAFT_389522 [Trichoderma evansii]